MLHHIAKQSINSFITLLIIIATIWSMRVHSAIPTHYYDSVDPATSFTLRSSLHEIIDDHQRFPYTSSSTDTWDILESADQDPDNPNNVIDIYKNAVYSKQGGGNSFYNREHSWPKSYGFPKDGSTNYPYTDAHHLFIANSGYNSSRSNKPFANCLLGCSEKSTDVNHNRGGGGFDNSNWTTGSGSQGIWETWQSRKGDSARALLYLDVRYEGGVHNVTGISEPDLILTDDRNLIESSKTGSNVNTAYMGLKSTLIQWHKDDPVDDFERRRNDAVYSFQGNRNPFIDHPEYVTCVFEDNCNGGGTDTTPPTSPSGFNANGGNQFVALTWTANSESDLAGYNVYRSETSGGTYNKINSSLVTTDSYTDNTVVNSTTYYYVITAVDNATNESTNSSETSATPTGGTTPPASSAWINEFHYDNASSDVGEFVEIAGTANLDLSGWTIVAYNGNNGQSYKTISLSGVISDQQSGFGTISFTASGLQNGAPDGLALVDNTGTVVQFISYEGSLLASNGPAAGMTSENIGVSETSSTPIGYSLQLVGTGQGYSDFSWQSASADSAGQLNANQSFVASGGPDLTAPEAPNGFSAVAGIEVVDLSWLANSESDLAGYNLYRSETQGGAYTKINTALLTNTSYSDSAVVASTIYYYVVAAQDNAGNESVFSAEFSATPLPNTIPPTAWINEFHYDNAGSDTGEFIEIAGTNNLDLSGWTIVAYNGKNGKSYKTISLSGVISNQQNGFGTVNFSTSGLQNGAPDGLALVDNTGTVVQFISYEGTMTASNGAASGMTSENIGVSESSSTSVGYSLQLSGSGQSYSDFTWQAASTNTAGQVNSNQSF